MLLSEPMHGSAVSAIRFLKVHFSVKTTSMKTCVFVNNPSAGGLCYTLLFNTLAHIEKENDYGRRKSSKTKSTPADTGQTR